MSENNEYVTIDDFAKKLEAITAFMEAIAEQADKNQKRSEAELATVTNLSERLVNVEGALKQILDAINQSSQQQAQAPAAPAARQKLDLAEITSAVREAAAAYKEVKTAAAGDLTELERYGMGFAEIAKREALAAMKLSIRRGLRKGIISTNEVETIIGEHIDKAAGASHEPVL